MMIRLFAVILLVLCSKGVDSYGLPSHSNVIKQNFKKWVFASIMVPSSVFLTMLPIDEARAGIDATVLQKYVETQAALDGADVSFTELPSGVSYREFRTGRGEKTLSNGKTVTCKLTARAKTLFTPKDPGGVKFYDSKIDSPDKDAEGQGVLTWVFGAEDSPVPVGLEEAMTGMKRGAIRRVDVPSVQIYRARKDGRLPAPAKKSEEENRIYGKMFKTTGDTIFEVLVERITSSE